MFKCITKIELRDDAHEAKFKTALTSLASILKQDKECVNFKIYQSSESVATFIVYYEWTSKITWYEHMSNPHSQKLSEFVNDIITGFQPQELIEL